MQDSKEKGFVVHTYLRGGMYVFLILSIITTSLLVVVSYKGLQRVIFTIDPLIKGKKLSVLAAEIRSMVFSHHTTRAIRFQSKDGTSLAGMLIERNGAKANLLLCHGYRKSKETLHAYLKMFPDYNIFMFDFRGHGESGGDLTTIGYLETQDVIAAAQFMDQEMTSRNKRRLPMLAIGVSMGGASLIKALSQEPSLCDAIVIDSTYAVLWDEIQLVFTKKSGLPLFPFLPIMKTMGTYYAGCDIAKMRPVDDIKNVKVPMMLIHSSIDHFMPTYHALKLYNSAVQAERNIKLWIGPPADHGKLHVISPDIYKKKVGKFFNRLVA